MQCAYYNAMDLIREGNGANQTICRQTNKTEKIAYIYRCILVCIMHAKGVPGLWVAHTHTHTLSVAYCFLILTISVMRFHSRRRRRAVE